MKRIRLVTLCLMAAFAFSAAVVSSASALPEILFKFTNGNIANGKFTSKGGASELTTVNGNAIRCTSVTNKGSFHNAHLGLVLILFEGCTTKGLFGETLICTTKGQLWGDIHLPSLEFHLGLAHNQSGTNTTIPAIIILLPKAGIEFDCEGLNKMTVTVTGSVIGALQTVGGAEPKVGEKLKEANLVFKQTSNGMQELTLILLPLGGGTRSNQHLESTILLTEESAEVLTDKLEGFKNSNEEATEIELEAG